MTEDQMTRIRELAQKVVNHPGSNWCGTDDALALAREVLLVHEAESVPATTQGWQPKIDELRARVWGYMNEVDSEFCVDIMEDFLKLLGSSLPHKESDLAAPPTQAATSGAGE